MGPPSASPLTCPRCGLFDHVQKVSAVVSHGISTGRITGNSTSIGSAYIGELYATTLMVDNTSLTESYQTMLSARLTPPQPPVYHSPWGALSIVAITLCAVGAGCGGLAGGLALLTDPTNLFGWLVLIVWLTLCLGPIAPFIWLKRVDDHKRRTFAAFEYPRWQHAMAKWNDLYYCGRDDTVFLAHARQFAGANERMWLLYQP